MSLFRRRPSGTQQQHPAPLDPATHAGSVQHGGDVGHGQVPTHRAFTDPDLGRRVPMLGQGVLVATAQDEQRLPPDSAYADRVQHGGTRTFPHFGEYIDEPGNTGGYLIITGRQPYIITDAVIEQVQATPPAVFRETPLPESCRRVPVIGGSL